MQVLLGPLTPVLVEESWEHSPQGLKEGQQPPLHRTWEPIPAEWRNDDLGKVYLPLITAINTAVKSAQEHARADKMMGSSLESNVSILLDNADTATLLEPLGPQLAEILVVSDLHF